MAEAEELRPINPLEGFAFADALRKGWKLAREVPNEVAANYRDITEGFRKNPLNAGPAAPLVFASNVLRSYQQGKEREKRGGETVLTETPFATHTSGDPTVKVAGMVADPLNLAGAGIGAKAAAVLGGVVKGTGRKAATKVAETVVPKLADAPAAALADVPAAPVVVEAAEAPTKAARVKKQPKAVASVFENVTDPAVATKMAMGDAHLKVDPKTGKYIGAPDWVDSPQALGTMRRDALSKVEGGMFNADWYDRQRALATSLADDPARQSLFARGTAAYSPQAMPKVELPTFLRQHNAQMLTGEPLQARTAPQMRNVAQAYNVDPQTKEVLSVDPTRIKLGRKTGPYAEAKDPTVPAESLFKAPSDIWHGRVMGYPGKGGKPFSRGFTPQETGFLTGENIRLTEAAKAEGMPVGDVKGSQAASWGTVRMEDLAAEDARRFARETKARDRYEADPEKWKKRNRQAGKLGEGEMGPPQSVPKSPPSKPKPVRTEEELRAYASEGLDTAKPRQAANITSEAIPGTKTGHLTGIQDLPDAVKQKYTSDILRATGRDPVVERLGLYSEKPEATKGIWTEDGVTYKNPAWVDRVMVSNVGDSGTGIRTPEIEREALDIAAQTGAYLRGQAAGAWNRFLPKGMSPKVGQMNAARAQGLTPEQIDEMINVGLSPVDVGEGTHHITRFGNEGPIAGSQKDVQQIVPGAERGTMETGYQEAIGPKGTEGTGVATDRLIESYERSKIANLPERMGTSSRLPDVARAQNEIDRALAQEHNLPAREDLMKARALLSEGGIPALIAYVKKHGSQGLPAVLGPMVAELFRQEQQQAPGEV